MSILEIKNLSKVYGSGHTQVKAVDDISLEINESEIVLVMGPSGSGKTTFLTMIGALLKPSVGEITFNCHPELDSEPVLNSIQGSINKNPGFQVKPGMTIEKAINLTQMSERDLPAFRLKNLGFVFQSFNLLSSLTALENVAVPLIAAGTNKREAFKKAKAALEKLGLGRRLDNLPRDLSGGEKQRVSIARALVNDPKIILADEPTANLDSKIGHEVMNLFCSIGCEQQKTVIIVSHDERIKDVAHRVLYIEDGKLVREEKGRHEEACTMKHRPAN
ncbi:MAG: ABC transporter ATP-binding protein [Patescibacteria group bacterium]|jgi:putative ABC transport system ATP-binding protein